MVAKDGSRGKHSRTFFFVVLNRGLFFLLFSIRLRPTHKHISLNSTAGDSITSPQSWMIQIDSLDINSLTSLSQYPPNQPRVVATVTIKVPWTVSFFFFLYSLDCSLIDSSRTRPAVCLFSQSFLFIVYLMRCVVIVCTCLMRLDGPSSWPRYYRQIVIDWPTIANVSLLPLYYCPARMVILIGHLWEDYKTGGPESAWA